MHIYWHSESASQNMPYASKIWTIQFRNRLNDRSSLTLEQYSPDQSRLIDHYRNIFVTVVQDIDYKFAYHDLNNIFTQYAYSNNDLVYTKIRLIIRCFLTIILFLFAHPSHIYWWPPLSKCYLILFYPSLSALPPSTAKQRPPVVLNRDLKPDRIAAT